MHRGKTKHIEIRPRRCTYGGGLRIGVAFHRRRGPAGFVFGNDARSFRRSKVGQVEWKLSGQKLIENDSERINVGVDSYAVAADLLRRGIRRGHQAQPSHGLHDRDIQAFHLFSNPKIEQPDRAVVLHQNVGWFQVTMDDGLPMRVLHGLTY